MTDKRKDIYLEADWDRVQKNIGLADQYVKDNYVVGQPYLYTYAGEPVIFKKVIGFDTDED